VPLQPDHDRTLGGLYESGMRRRAGYNQVARAATACNLVAGVSGGAAPDRS
jgi:hypothetical protein